LAFECQMFEALPMGELDVPMDVVVTEMGNYGQV
jgi:5-formyltetrahydrofolate cyclo-ligase